MSSKEVASLSASEKLQLSYSYAALLLADSEKDLTDVNLDKLVKASGNTVNKNWAAILARSLKGKDVNAMLSCGGGGSGSGAESAPEQAKEAPKDTKKAPEPAKKEDSEDYGGFDMFG